MRTDDREIRRRERGGRGRLGVELDTRGIEHALQLTGH